MADQSKKSRSGKHRRSSVGEFRTRASRRLAVETIEGRLLLSVAPLMMPDPAYTILLTPYAAPTSGENSSGTAPAMPPPSDQGGFINPTGPTVLSIGNSTGQTSSTASLPTLAVGQEQAYFEPLIYYRVTGPSMAAAVPDGINPVFIRFDFGGEGGPIGIAPMNRPGSQSPASDSPSPLSAERNSSAARPESSMLAYAGTSKLSGEWARPTISEVAGGEPTVAEKHRSKTIESDFLPTSFPKMNVEQPSTKHGTGADAVNSGSALSREIPVNAVMMREPRQGDRLIDRAMATHDSWIFASQQSAFSAQQPSILSPSSHIDFILDDQTVDHHAPLILTLKPDDRQQKAAALKHTSMMNFLRSSLSYEPVLVALLLDYVAARYYQHEDKKRAGSASQPVPRQ